MGANIYPEDLESALYANAELAQKVRSYCMSLHEGEHMEVRPKFEFEVVHGDITPALEQTFREKITEHLIVLNKDFAEAWHEHRESLMPVIALWQEGQGPFTQNAGRIKQVRITA
jgi:hypothetical protein